MQEIDPEQYSRIFPLVDACSLHGHMAFAYAVLEHRQTGRIFVNDTEDSMYALVCNDSGFFLSFGHPEKGEVVEQVQKLHNQPLVEENSALFGTSAEWDAVLAAAFSQYGTQPVCRLGFQHRPSPGHPPQDWHARIPVGYHLEPITAQLAESIIDGSGTGNFGIDPWFIRVAGGPERYASPGLGYAIMEGDQIASICGYCGLGHGKAELEVGTVAVYLGKGLATLVCSAFLEQCHNKGWLPVYTCDSENQSSIALAHKLGFIEVEEILGYKL